MAGSILIAAILSKLVAVADADDQEFVYVTPLFLPPTLTSLDKCVPHTACPFGLNGTDIIKKRLGLEGKGGG